LLFYFFIEKKAISRRKINKFNSEIDHIFKNSDNPALSGDKSKIKLKNGDVLTFRKTNDDKFYLHYRSFSKIIFKRNNKIKIQSGFFNRTLKIKTKNDQLKDCRVLLTKPQISYLCTHVLTSIKINGKKIKINKNNLIKYITFFI
jgi:hypothetical protein